MSNHAKDPLYCFTSFFLYRYQNEDPPKLKSPSANVEGPSTNEGTETELQENSEAGISTASASVERTTEPAEFAIELPRTLKYDCGSPDCGPTQKVGLQRCQNIDQPAEKADLWNNQTEQGCDWERLVSDTADLLIFSSPNDTEAFRRIIQKSQGLEKGLGASLSNFLQNNVSDSQKMQLLFQLASGEQPDIGDTLESLEIKHTQEDLGSDDLTSMGIYLSGGLESEVATYGAFADGKVHPTILLNISQSRNDL